MPITRSAGKASAASSAIAPVPDSKVEREGEFFGFDLSFMDSLDDCAPLQTRDAKALKDATSSAITQVWADTMATTALLSQKINEGNSVLTDKLNESFAAVGKRLDSLPTIAMLQQDVGVSKGKGGGARRRGPQGLCNHCCTPHVVLRESTTEVCGAPETLSMQARTRRVMYGFRKPCPPSGPRRDLRPGYGLSEGKSSRGICCPAPGGHPLLR
ncbi:hypothetical protein V3C99_000360 [Haemonchus contortus]